MNAKTAEKMMNEENFEKGLTMLLKHAYHAPQASETFRANLLQDLKASQRTKVQKRREKKMYCLYGGLFAAAAAVAAAVLPGSLFDSPAAPAVPAAVATTNTAAAAAPQSAVPAASLSNAVAFALQPLNVKHAEDEQWHALAPDEQFTLTPDMEIRTPVGMVGNTGFGVRNGPAVMLVGMSKLRIGASGNLQVLDGQAMLDLSRTSQACQITLNRQQLALQPGAMVLLSVNNNDDYAAGGAPAPVMAVLHGAVRSGDNALRELNAGRVYQLYDTGTGLYPNRDLSYSENQQRFMPMIDAIRAANVREW